MQVNYNYRRIRYEIQGNCKYNQIQYNVQLRCKLQMQYKIQVNCTCCIYREIRQIHELRVSGIWNGMSRHGVFDNWKCNCSPKTLCLVLHSPLRIRVVTVYHTAHTYMHWRIPYAHR